MHDRLAWSASSDLNRDHAPIERGSSRWTTGGKMVGVAGFAPAASRSRSERSPELSYTPSMVGLVGFAPTTSGPPDRRAPELRYRPKMVSAAGFGPAAS